MNYNMEIIKLTENNIQELSDKLNDLGYDDFAPILKRTKGDQNLDYFILGLERKLHPIIE